MPSLRELKLIWTVKHRSKHSILMNFEIWKMFALIYENENLVCPLDIQSEHDCFSFWFTCEFLFLFSFDLSSLFLKVFHTNKPFIVVSFPWNLFILLVIYQANMQKRYRFEHTIQWQCKVCLRGCFKTIMRSVVVVMVVIVVSNNLCHQHWTCQQANNDRATKSNPISPLLFTLVELTKTLSSPALPIGA